MTVETKIGRGSPPKKWPFFATLRVGQYAEEADATKYSALRTAASRANNKGERKFTVSKETNEKDVVVIRVYRTK